MGILFVQQQQQQQKSAIATIAQAKNNLNFSFKHL